LELENSIKNIDNYLINGYDKELNLFKEHSKNLIFIPISFNSVTSFTEDENQTNLILNSRMFFSIIKPSLSFKNFQKKYEKLFQKLTFNEGLNEIKKHILKEISKEKSMICLIIDDYNRILEVNCENMESSKNKG
jgi:hypothetical protein